MSVLIVSVTRTSALGSKFPEESLNLQMEIGVLVELLITHIDGKGSTYAKSRK